MTDNTLGHGPYSHGRDLITWFRSHESASSLWAKGTVGARICELAYSMIFWMSQEVMHEIDTHKRSDPVFAEAYIEGLRNLYIVLPRLTTMLARCQSESLEELEQRFGSQIELIEGMIDPYITPRGTDRYDSRLAFMQNASSFFKELAAYLQEKVQY